MIKYILSLLLFTNFSFAQISSGTTDVNVLGGSLTLSGTSTVSGTVAVSNSSFGISGSLPAGTNGIGSITNTVFGSTQSGVWNVGLSTGSNVIGSISNTGFGITGTLPAFASTPTVNIGTTNGLALEAGHAASTDTSTAAINSKLTTTANGLKVDGSAVNQPVTISGTPTVTANIGTTNGLALDASLGTLNTSVNSLLKPASTLAAVTSITNPVGVTGTFFQATQPVSIAGTVSTSGTINAALPAGTNSIGQVTTNAGTNTSTAALNLETTQSAMNGKIPTGLNVKAASTAAVATDPALVVAISPNNTIPTSRTWSLTASTDSTASWLKDGNGFAIASTDDGNGGKAIEVAIAATDFVFSTVNSSTTQLASGATFTGAVESVVNQQSASVLLTSDQNGTLIFSEYIDAGGTRLTRTTTASIIANIPYSRSFVVNGNYFKAAFTNNGGATTTTFNLNTAYGTIPAATALGNGQVSLDEVNGTALTLGQKSPALSIPVVTAANPTYAAASAPFAPAATPTDIFTITGSATKTIEVTKLSLNCTQTTSGLINTLVIRRSTADTAGTAVAATVVPLDSTNAAGTATVNAYTANPTLGTIVGNVRSRKLLATGAAGTAGITDGDLVGFELGTQLLTLRGTGQVLAINLNGTTLTGGNCVAYAEWTEK
jgi:hypothetical protein